MVDKLHDYQGPAGRFHTIRDNIKTKFANWRENHRDFDRKMVDKLLHRDTHGASQDSLENYDFTFKFKRKTRWELIRLCAIVMGIEFSYSAITGFSSPILLQMGVSKKCMSMTFSLSALLGFFLSPLCGSLSDRCTLPFGRRRIFIVVFAVLELLGLYLIPHMHGIYLEYTKEHQVLNVTTAALPRANQSVQLVINQEDKNNSMVITERIPNHLDAPLWIIMLAVLGIVIADHFADNLQNPSRAYLLDVCNEEDHTRGLSTFTILAGCGGTIGYGFGSINWNDLFIGQFMGGQIKTVFFLSGVLFFLCVLLTITTFKEIPLKLLPKLQQQKYMIYCRKSKSIEDDENDDNNDGEGRDIKLKKVPNLDADETSDIDNENSSSNYVRKQKSLSNGRNDIIDLTEEEAPSLRHYLESIVKLPYSLQILLFTNVLCWMSHVSYSLYFTDYVGEAIFLGDPVAIENSVSRTNYEEGVRFACRGMAVYSFSCMICSIFMERAIQKFGLRKVYLVNIAIDTTSMFFMYFFNSKVASMAFSFASGILYCTIFTIPYIIVARYHTLNVFEVSPEGDYIYSTQVRGIGTDVAIIGSSVFIAQFFLSLGMGFIIHWYGSTEAVPMMCMILSLFALIGAFKVVYLDL